MNSKIMKELATNPRAHMDFKATGRMPRMRDPLVTPLRTLLMSMSPRERAQYRGIQVTRELGYTGNHRFQSAEHLYRWLGGTEQVLERQTIASESWAIRGFQKRLDRDDLARNCAQAPKSMAP